MSNPEKAASLFQEGFSCSQAVLAAYSEQFELDEKTALKISSGFGGGMHIGGACGAVTGAFMVIGLKFGRTTAEDIEAKEKTYRLVKDFTERFITRHGSINCRELLGCDISVSEGMRIAKEKNLFSSVCPKFVTSAAEILDQILA
jgi:C_GCAxxG_C_C family probable redox protein